MDAPENPFTKPASFGSVVSKDSGNTSSVKSFVPEDEPVPENLLPTEVTALRSSFKRFVPNDGSVVGLDRLPLVFNGIGGQFSDQLIYETVAEINPDGKNTGVTLGDILLSYSLLKDLGSYHTHTSHLWARPAEPYRQAKRQLLLNDTPPRTVWNLLFMFVSIVNMVIVIFRDESEDFHRKIEPGFLTFDIIFTGIYCFNIWLTSRTIVVTPQETLSTSTAVMSRYLRTWLIPDIIAAIPLDILLYVSGASRAGAAASHLRIINVFRSMFIWNVSGLIPLTGPYIRFYFQFLPLLKLFYGAFAISIGFAGLFIVVKSMNNSMGDLGEYPTITAIYFVVQTVTTVGYGDIKVSGLSELWFTISLTFIGLLINGFVIGRLVTLLQLTDASTLRQDKLRETLAVLQFFDIPQQLQIEILNFQSHALWTSLGTAFNHMTSTLPAAMNENMLFLQRAEILRQLPAFRDLADAPAAALAVSLESEYRKPEEYVSCAGEPHQGIRFLLFGFVDQVDAKGRYLKTLKTGDVFGFDRIMELSEEEFNYKALSYCDLLILRAESFHQVLSRFPSFAECMKKEGRGTQMLVDSAIGQSPATATTSHANTKRITARKKRIRALQVLNIKLRTFKEKLISIRTIQHTEMSNQSAGL